MDFEQYRKHFARQIRWVSDLKLNLYNKKDTKSQQAFEQLEAYERDLHITCRHLDILLKKYPMQMDISIEERKYAERLCYDVRFIRKEKLEEILKNVRK